MAQATRWSWPARRTARTTSKRGRRATPSAALLAWWTAWGSRRCATWSSTSSLPILICRRWITSNGTTIGPTGFVYFTETALGFALSSAGEAIYLVNSNRTRVVDCISFEGQENGVATGRYPDGAPTLSRLAAKTPGAPNAPLHLENVVINEIMFHPVTEDENDEFVELYNRSASSINLAGWSFTDGIDFTFPANTVIPANGYRVVARNAAHLLANYPN